MAILKNHISALMRPMGQPADFYKVHKDSIKIHPVNSSMLRLKIYNGKLLKFSKRIPMRAFNDHDIPKHWLYAYPGGIDTAMINPENTKFICGVRNHCHKDLMEDYKKLLMQIQEVEFDRDKFRQERDEYQKELKALQKQMSLMK